MSARRREDAAAVLLVDLREALALAVEDQAQARQARALQRRVVRQVRDRLVVVGDHLAEPHGRVLDRLVLAELLVDGVQLAEVEALEGLGLAGDGLRVLHRGGDEVVDVDVLDAEGRRHVGAAGLEEARHLPLVPLGVVGGPDGVRLDGDLAQGERGREDLDEDGAHERVGLAARSPGERAWGCRPPRPGRRAAGPRLKATRSPLGGRHPRMDARQGIGAEQNG